MNLKSPIAVPPNLLAGPRTIGDDTDYIRIDPENASITFAGTARPYIDLWLSMTDDGATANIAGPPNQHYIIFSDGATQYARFQGLASTTLDWSSDVGLYLLCYPFSDPATDVMLAYNLAEYSPDRSFPISQSVTAIGLGPADCVEGTVGAGIRTLELATIPGGTVTEPPSGLPTMLALWLQRQGGHGSDTLNDSLFVYGAYLRGLRKGI